MNTANGEPEIDPEYYTELRPLDENVLFAVSDPQVLGRQLTGAEIEAMEDEAAKRKENVLGRFKRLNAKPKPIVTFDEKTYPVESVTIDYAWKNAEANAEYLIRGTGLLSPYKADGSRNTAYLAGPMSSLPNFGFDRFDAARDDLTAKGFKVISPADIDREVGFDPSVGTLDDFDLPAAIKRDVDAILGCDAVVLLPGHEDSKGATAERYVANWAGVPCFTYPDLNPFEEAEWPGIVDDEMEQDAQSFENACRDAAVQTVCCQSGFGCDKPKDILLEAYDVTRGDRQSSYGPPDQDFRRTADMWTGLFRDMLKDGVSFEPFHVAQAMILLKMSRQLHQRKRDNWTDTAGYARCGQLCDEAAKAKQ